MLVRGHAEGGEPAERGIKLDAEIRHCLLDKGRALSAAAAVVELAEPAFQPGRIVRRYYQAEVKKTVHPNILRPRGEWHGEQDNPDDKAGCVALD